MFTIFLGFEIIATVISFLFYLRKRQNITVLILLSVLALLTITNVLNILKFPFPIKVSEFLAIFIFVLIFFAILYSTKFFNEYERTVTHLKTLSDIDRIMLTGLTPKSITGGIKEKLISILDCDALAVYTVDIGRNCTVFTNHNLCEDFHAQTISKDNYFFWKIIEDKKPVLLTNISKDENFGFGALLKKYGFRSCIGVPLVLKGSPMGILLLLGNKKIYSKKDIQFIEGIARQLVIVIERLKAVQRIKEMNVESVLSLVQAIETRDPCTKGHSLQVAKLAREIARLLNMPEKNLELLEFAGLLHDVGKIAVPESILKKPGPLSSEEWLIMKKHPVHSAEIIKPIKNLSEIEEWIRFHHERWDGSGYPEGLKENQIPFEARILAICDAYSAMIGKRPYREGLTDEQARDEIKKFSGRQFDPVIVKTFLSLSKNFLKSLLG
uniref:HD domain-containing protein n=1 Tax=candidate division WOR-3 bacterium TaxID=2052148 RepID=A0A7C4X991_UNCW3